MREQAENILHILQRLKTKRRGPLDRRNIWLPTMGAEWLEDYKKPGMLRANSDGRR